MVVVEEVRKSDQIPKQSQSKQIINRTFFHIGHTHKVVQKNTFEVILYTFKKRRKQWTNPSL